VTNRRVRVLGLSVADADRPAIAEEIVSRSRDGNRFIAFAIHIGGLLHATELSYRQAMSVADLVYADGISAVLLGRLAGGRSIGRTVTTDLGWDLLHGLGVSLGRTPRVALIGGEPGIAEKAASVLEFKGAGSRAFATHGFHADWVDVLARLEESRPDILFVGLGAPKEMTWVERHEYRLPAVPIVTCGGWFGYIIGDEARAPVAMRAAGLEWLYRLGLQPKRLGPRYAMGAIRLPFLALRVLKERLER
jgi:N-acetylglucosaminyldiphosphoundecaprenol N-acetyl-beta-D-mannosaminyltransferase